jgi:hypothetical protein
MRVLACENWLAIIGEADHAGHAICQLNGLTVARAQQAFDAQYGKGEFSVRDHGTVITVFSYPGYIRQRVAKGVSQADAEAHIASLKERVAELGQ